MTSHAARVLSSEQLSSHLLEGGASVIPTDTVPGLAIAPPHADAIWRLKRRPADKPLILMGASVEVLLNHVQPSCRNDARRLAEQHWPGALTLVLPAHGVVLEALNPGGTCLGLRIPNCAQSRELLQRTGPLATSSVNPSGEPPAMTPEQAAVYFPNLPQLGPQPWLTPSGQASTVISWTSLGRWKVLRRGAVMPEEIAKGG